MKVTSISPYEAKDIEEKIERILSDLGNPEPPIKLVEVRDLLSLDLQYYSSKDTSAVDETIHRIKIAGKQVIKRPTLLIEAIKKSKLSALWLPDKKRILIDEEVHHLKHRWNEAHEIGHSVIPWHKQNLMGDDEFSLMPSCHDQLEREANYAAGQLLFLGKTFSIFANDYPLSWHGVEATKKIFGNTWASTLWRYVEQAHKNKPVVGIISGHPFHPKENFDPDNPCRYVISSPLFCQVFSNISERGLFQTIKQYCNLNKGGPLGSSEVLLADINGEEHIFSFNSFSNKYDVLTLGIHKCKRHLSIAI